MEGSLYNFGFHVHWQDLFKVLLLIFPGVIWLFSSIFDNQKWLRVTVRVTSIGLAVFIVWQFFINPIVQYNCIKREVREGNVYSVEGEVTDFASPTSSWGGHVNESFNIDGVSFSYSGTENFGYNKLNCNGGVIEGNGQKLRITYYVIPHSDRKVICKIEQK